MKRKNTGKRLIAALLIASLGFTGMKTAEASNIKKANDAKKKAEQDLNNANSQINEIEKKQQKLQSEINEKDAELVNLLVNIGILEDELGAKNTQLEEVKGQLKEAQKTEKTQYGAMKQRIKVMYERGDNAMIEALFSSADMTDFLHRVEYVSSVYEYDRDLLERYKETVKQVAEMKETVETEKAELEAMQSEYNEQQVALEGILAEKKSQMGSYDNQLASAQAAAAEYKKTIAAQNQIIKDEERKAREAAEKAAAQAAAANAQNNSGKGGAKNPADGNTTSSAGNQNTSAPAAADGGSQGANPPQSTGVSGSSVVSYACKFVGNPYVWGGTSLTNGADCSGFVMSVYSNFGIGLPHSSAAMQGCGKAVSYANAQPGDLICYSGHVAIYMGGGQIVHAQSAATGITTSSATYRTIVAVRRVL